MNSTKIVCFIQVVRPHACIQNTAKILRIYVNFTKFLGMRFTEHLRGTAFAYKPNVQLKSVTTI